MTTRRTRLTGGIALVGAAALCAGALTQLPATADERPTSANQASSARHAQDGTVRGVYDHLLELEEIADANGGNRASGLPGYEASVDYVMDRLEKAGYTPRKQSFPFEFFQQTAPSVFEQTAPTQQTFEEDVDYGLMTYSGSGDVTAPVEGVDLDLANPDLSQSTSGCEPEDFADFTAGHIALVRRGACAFGQKAANAEDAGAVGVIVMNTGTDGNTEAFAGTLGASGYTTPVIGTSFAIGESLAAEGTEVRLAATTVSETRETWNVIAQTRKGNGQNVVMAGAHLDSVAEGEGVNDNGSGSAALLETAEAMAKGKAPKNKVRFAWWGAEELGLLGSEHYVTDLSENKPGKFQNIALYLNFDMVGSPNYMLGVYDGNGDSFDPPESTEAPEGSAAIEKTFHRYFDRIGTGSVDTAFSGRSDYGPFIALNVPAGGLFTGAEGVKTAEEAAMFGGTAGEAYDPCYHIDCDDLGNVSRAALKANLGAIMNSVMKYSRSTRSVNGDSTGHQPPPPAEPARRIATSDHLHGQESDENRRDYHAQAPRR